MASNILVIGGSRHIGYYASLRFLDAGARATFLLRSPAVFDDDVEIQKHVKAGKAKLIQGDGLVIQDVRDVWAKASEHSSVDLIIFTVGFSKSHTSFQILESGINSLSTTLFQLVTECLQNLLCEMPKHIPLPKIIVLSTVGVSRTSRQHVPLIHRPLYGWLISQQLRDKLGMERVIYHCAGWRWNAVDGEPDADILAEGWKDREGLPEPGMLNNAMVLRASILNDGECKADSTEGAYRAVEGPIDGWSISRKDVAHFIFEAVTNGWEKYGNKQISVSY